MVNDIAHIEALIDRFRRGYPVALRAGGDVLLAASAENALAETVECFKAYAKPLLLLSPWRAKHLGFPGEKPVAFALPAISRDTLNDWVESGAPANSLPPQAPLPSQAEAALTLAALSGMLPAVLAVPVQERHDEYIDSPAILDYAAAPPSLEVLGPVQLPTIAAENTIAHAFRDRASGLTHIALVIGDASSEKAPLVRLHSSCLTGDLLGSLRCDCGGQLHKALSAIAESGGGILLYLQQEGRGIGLFHKLRAYQLQEQGHDTVDANTLLGFAPDMRDFRIAGMMLKRLGIERIRLLSNNPAKVKALVGAGIDVTERIPLQTSPHTHNEAYLAAKRAKLGHI